MLDASGVDYSKILKRYDVELEVAATPEQMAAKMLPKDPVFNKVALEVMNKQIKTVGPTVAEALKERDPLAVINEGLVAGMEIVAKLYAEHVYFLPDIMMAAKTMEIGIALAEKQVPGGRELKGTVIMHAAEGDPHDIGKNIAAVMMRSSGYEVIDMGRDVPIKDVIAETVKVKPLFTSGTALMTTTMTAFPAIAKGFQDAGLNIPLMGCGGAVNRDYANSYDLGIYSEKAPQTPVIAQKILDGYDWKKIRDEWDSIVGE
ncbi:MAG: cobalamin-dependent protein [Candidatus Methanomethylophilaceae archaeon]|jgi:methanol corrinoid protein|nr:methanol--corrinoid methyltransferase [Thermoplasmata archaeon]MBQ3685233.1 cobalamin-dependent protein [Candidatus Methanomethylophilaceae archaeon]